MNPRMTKEEALELEQAVDEYVTESVNANVNAEIARQRVSRARARFENKVAELKRPSNLA